MTAARSDLMALEPCPFCGGEAERVDIDPMQEEFANAGGSVIQCKSCGASSPVHFDRKENLDTSWNTRAASQPDREAVNGDPLDDLVARFSAALLAKLKAARVKYGAYDEGWREPGWEADCQKHLIAHLAKGDPRDVAAYCAFMWHHGWSTVAPALSAPVGEPYAYAKQIGSDIVRTHSLKHMMPEARAEYTIPLYTHLPAPAVGPDVREAWAKELRDISNHTRTLHYKIISLRLDKVAAALTRPLGGEDTKIIYRDGGSTPADLNPINHEQRNRRRK